MNPKMQAEDRVSVVILTDQFDAKLSRCITSIPSNWPIMVCATGVKPNNSIRQQHPQLSIIVAPPITNFSQTRNHCLKLVKSQWVLFLDSDEILQPFDETTFQQLLHTTGYSGMSVMRTDIFHGKRLRYGEAGRQHIVRLMKPQESTFVGSVHEIAQVTGTIVDSKLLILHDSHNSISQFVTKVTSYAHKAALERTYDGMQTWLELLLFPPGKFIWNFGIKLGFLDGWRGLVYAVLMSFHSLCVRLFLIERHLRP